MRAAFVIVAFILAAPAKADPPAAGATACSGCHGAAGIDLSKLTAAEIEAAMAAFRDGTREATLMGRIAKGFSAEESAAIARWIAGG